MKQPNVTKEGLSRLSVDKLKATAKKLGVKLIDPKTNKAKTKVQLVNGVLMKIRLTGKSNTVLDSKRPAKPPGKRVSASGRVYTEKRTNRADVSRRLMLGAKPTKTALAAAEFKKAVTELNKAANQVLKINGGKGLNEAKKQLSAAMSSCKRNYGAFYRNAK